MAKEKQVFFCKECGCLMGVKQDKRNHDKIIYNMNCNQYSRNPNLHLCTSHFINYSKLQNAVLNCLQRHIAKINLKEIISDLSYSEKLKKKKLCIQKEKYKKIEKLNQLYDDKVNNKLDDNIFKILSERIIYQIELLDKKLDEIGIDAQDLNRFLDISKSRLLISKLIDKITISRNKELDIYYNFN